MDAFVDLYSKEFIGESGGRYCFKHDDLLAEVIAAKNTRAAIARLTRAQASGVADAVQPAEDGRCIIC